MSKIDQIVAAAIAVRKIRDAELQAAFINPDALRVKIFSDVAELVADIGGYIAPIGGQKRKNWIANMMLTDPMFIAKVESIANLVTEYTSYAATTARRQQAAHACLGERAGLRIEKPETNALAQDLGQLAARHGLRGAVLVSFAGDRVGVNSSGEGIFGPEMDRLASRILAAIDDGQFDPTP